MTLYSPLTALRFTSALEGEIDAQRREGDKRQSTALEYTPLPNPPPQGGREQPGTCRAIRSEHGEFRS